MLNIRTPASFTQRPVTTVTKRLPFSTIGIGLTVSELFYRFSEMFRSSRCSIYSLFRVSLAQLDLQHQVSTDGGCSTYPYDSLFFDVPGERKNLTKSHPDNFKVLVYIIETFGRFKHAGSDYVTIIPEDLRENPFFLGFTSLERVISRLSEGTRRDILFRQRYFEHNPLPGAVVDVEFWVLKNPEAFRPNDYRLRVVQS